MLQLFHPMQIELASCTFISSAYVTYQEPGLGLKGLCFVHGKVAATLENIYLETCSSMVKAEKQDMLPENEMKRGSLGARVVQCPRSSSTTTMRKITGHESLMALVNCASQTINKFT